MTNVSDPSAFQAWLIAIPSAITAASTWYMSRKTSKVGASTQEKTNQVVTEKSDETKEEVINLKQRVATLEQAIHQTRDNQILIAQNYNETMNRLHTQIGEARAVMEKSVPKPAAPIVPSPAPPSEKVPVPTEDPPKSFGKVILKP